MGWEGPMTHRQFLAWSYWLAEQWNNPSRSDNYMMQVACEVRRVLSRKPRSIQMKDFRLKFNTGTSSSKPKADPKLAVMASKSRWLSMVGKTKAGKPIGAKLVRAKPKAAVSPNSPSSQQNGNGR